MTELAVDVSRIEHELAALWRAEQGDDARAVTKAALWNVVAHTWNAREQTHATGVLGRVSAAVPQRTIVIRAESGGDAASGIASWISANCHLTGGGGQQVCSEEITIVASGSRVAHVPPLVTALLLPDMPVAVWWIGDLPADHHAYVEALFEPADRLIVDSADFGGASDLELVSRIAERTTTAPADLNWARIEEWRAATAALFDPPAMRERLGGIRRVCVRSGGGSSFAEISQALLYVAWLQAQSGTEIAFDLAAEGEARGIAAVELHFEDAAMAMIRRHGARGVVVASTDGSETELDCVTRPLAHATEDLIVRLLKRPEADRVYLKALRAAQRLVR